MINVFTKSRNLDSDMHRKNAMKVEIEVIQAKKC